MVVNSDTIYGMEWIDYEKPHVRLEVASDAVFRIPASVLAANGIPSTVAGNQLVLFHQGKQIPIYVSSNEPLENSDYIEFVGYKNRGELDSYLYNNPAAEQLNPNFSLFTDTAAYYLTYTDDINTTIRYTNVTNNLNNLPAPESSFFDRQEWVFGDQFIKDKINSEGARYSDYEEGEGFCNGFPDGNSESFTLNIPPPATSGADARLTLRYASNSSIHETEIVLNGSTLFTEDYFGWSLQNQQLNIPLGSLETENTLEIRGNAGSSDRYAIASISLEYARSYDLQGANRYEIHLPPSTQTRYLEIANFDHGGQNPLIYDQQNQDRFLGILENGVIKLALPPSAQERHLMIVAVGATSPVDQMVPVSFQNYINQGVDYLLLTHERWRNDGQGNDFVQEYANYRSSNTGGGYSTQIVEINQIYDQFGYGIRRSPLAIRNFIHYYKKNHPDVAYLFIIGKAREYHNFRTAAQLAAPSNKSFTIPTYGYPGADNLLVAPPGGNIPILSTARLAISSADDLRKYLEKVKALEASQQNSGQTIAERAWMKEILHLGGGSVNERDQIRFYLGEMEEIIENNGFGGNVTSVFKTSSDPVQTSNSERIFETINRGVSLITFFGHSGVGTFDFSIDNPENFDNFGKCPLMLSLGCYVGNLHTNAVGASERFVFFEDKGAIAFAASTGLGYLGPLRQYARIYYDLAGDASYG